MFNCLHVWQKREEQEPTPAAQNDFCESSERKFADDDDDDDAAFNVNMLTH